LPLRAAAFLRFPPDALSAGAIPAAGGQPGAAGEAGHVAAGLGRDDLRDPRPDSRDGHQPGDVRLVDGCHGWANVSRLPSTRTTPRPLPATFEVVLSADVLALPRKRNEGDVVRRSIGGM
jgi:hypothetical protein